MAKVKEVSSYSGSAWSTAVPIGANATNVDMATNPTDYDSSTSETSTALINTNDVKIISSDTDLTAWGKFNRFRKRVANIISQLVQESAFEIVDDNGTLKLYWYGSQAECPYTIMYQEGVYKLYYVYTTV